MDEPTKAKLCGNGTCVTPSDAANELKGLMPCYNPAGLDKGTCGGVATSFGCINPTYKAENKSGPDCNASILGGVEGPGCENQIQRFCLDPENIETTGYNSRLYGAFPFAQPFGQNPDNVKEDMDSDEEDPNPDGYIWAPTGKACSDVVNSCVYCGKLRWYDWNSHKIPFDIHKNNKFFIDEEQGQAFGYRLDTRRCTNTDKEGTVNDPKQTQIKTTVCTEDGCKDEDHNINQQYQKWEMVGGENMMDVDYYRKNETAKPPVPDGTEGSGEVCANNDQCSDNEICSQYQTCILGFGFHQLC